MANPEQLAKLKEGVEAWNLWRWNHPWVHIVLSSADLNHSILYKADLHDADLSGTNLVGASLNGVNFSEANLSIANLFEANLRYSQLYSANLHTANLSRANLSAAHLRATNFYQADLTEANLSGAILQSSILGDTNLTRATGLDSCVHEGPSVLDHATIIRSGMLPPAFLRGCGLAENYIEYLPSLLNQAIQFYSCFISYSTKDQEFAERLHADLQDKGVRCWFAPHDIAGGKKIHEQIDEAIRVYDRLLLILSEHSMRSTWVETEISKARKREMRDKRRMLFPVGLIGFQTLQDWECFDADTGKDSAREIREYFIPDFSNWKDHDSYKKAFDRLLRDLKAPAAEGASNS